MDKNLGDAPFSLKNRMGRMLWGTVCFLLFRPSPRPFHSWRSFLLRLFGATMGSNCHIYPGAIIWAPWNLDCADSAAIADGVIIYNQAKITLGSDAIVSQGSHLCTGTHDYESPQFPLFAFPITIGSRAWVCADCFVGPGVVIGDGAVIGARSVVLKDMPGWTVSAGHPCVPIKPRKQIPAV
jgi:putative colanic acid biosynthesis acetyltransferase WcaF